MNTRPLILIHGWSATSKSMATLAKWLRGKDFDVVDIHLANYISMQDEITLPDLGLAMRNAIKDKGIAQTRHSFDVVTHSTGALVAREYLRQTCAGDATKTPIKHLCMLAPANFGSPLAKLGKSLLGRLFNGWNWDGIFETGTQVLNALELASPYTFNLAISDLFDNNCQLFHPDNTLATVITGTSQYSASDKLKSVLHENGSDGVVRVSTANLNAHYFKIDFEKPPEERCICIPPAHAPIAFAVFDHSHGSITKPDDEQTPLSPEWQTLLNSLTLRPKQYPAHCETCAKLTNDTYARLRESNPKSEACHLYQHVVFRVRDQFGAPINDYFIEFYQEAGDPRSTVFRKMQTEILEKVVTNSTMPNHRSFLFDITDLDEFLRMKKNAKVRMSISAANISKEIRIRAPGGDSFIEIFRTADFPCADFPDFANILDHRGFRFPNQTMLIDITLHREPQPHVFTLTPQK